MTCRKTSTKTKKSKTNTWQVSTIEQPTETTWICVFIYLNLSYISRYACRQKIHVSKHTRTRRIVHDSDSDEPTQNLWKSLTHSYNKEQIRTKEVSCFINNKGHSAGLKHIFYNNPRWCKAPQWDLFFSLRSVQLYFVYTSWWRPLLLKN